MGKEKKELNFNKLADINQQQAPLDFQYELVFLLHYLLDAGLAKIAGRYIEGEGKKKPLFKHNDPKLVDDKPVVSIDRKTGTLLLKDPPKLLQNPETAKLLMNWIVQEFPVLFNSANKQYKVKLERKTQLVQIISGAAHYLARTEKNVIPQAVSNHVPVIEKTIRQFGNQKLPASKAEKIVWAFISFYLLLIVLSLYALNPKALFIGLMVISIFSFLLSVLLFFIFRKKTHLTQDSVKRIPANALLSLLLTGYAVFLYQFQGNGRFVSAMIILPLVFLVLFEALYSFTAKDVFNKRPGFFAGINNWLTKYKPNWQRTYEIVWLLAFASIAIFAAANLPLLAKNLEYILK